MPNELTPQEVAEHLEKIHPKNALAMDTIYQLEALKEAASIVRQYANGELRSVVHGRWIKRECEDELLAVCSECSYPVSWWHKTLHCPSCGALMDESKEGKSLNGKDGDSP